MKLRTKYNISYEINEEKKVVTAIAKVYEFDKIFYNYYWAINYMNAQREIKELESGKEFIGIARFKDGDVDDIEMAKKIAKWKALRQGNSYFKNVAFDWADVFEKAENDLAGLAYAGLKQENEYNNDIIKATRKES